MADESATEDDFRNRLKSTLGRCVTQKDNEYYLDAEKFFYEWFIVEGRSYVFVFNQNLKTTNIQYPELLALLSVHLYDQHGRNVDAVFTNSNEFKRWFTDIANSTIIARNRKIPDALFDRISRRICNAVVLDGYFGTCPAFIPPFMYLDARSVCGESGYVHSVGEVILFRNATKLTFDEVKERVKLFIEKKKHDKRAIFIVPYCHEDFSKMDRQTPFLKDGLDDIKMYIGKSSLGNEHFVTSIQKLEQYLQNELGTPAMVALSGDYKDARVNFIESFSAPMPRTWFWIMDSDIKSGSKFPDDRKLFILYEQIFKSENPYHWFDENKPGWVSHTTLPHSLCAAMLNLSRPWWPKNETVNICDPFGGSGTTYLEATKFTQVNVLSQDLSFFATQAARDNIEIFQKDAVWFDSISRQLSQLEKQIAVGNGFGEHLPKHRYQNMIYRLRKIARKLEHETGGNCLNVSEAMWKQASLEEPALENLEFRIFLYGFLRGYLRHNVDIAREGVNEQTAIRDELEKLRISFQGVKHILASKPAPNLDFIAPENLVNKNISQSRLKYGPGKYSIVVSPEKPEVWDLFSTTHTHIGTGDARNLPREQFDLVLCDPPYGFNTEEEIASFERLFSDSISSIIRSIKTSGGQVILALPDISFTGRPIPYFVQPRFAIREFIDIARSLRRELLRPIFISPISLTKFSPPYYWYSEKALKRAILHFWIGPIRSSDAN